MKQQFYKHVLAYLQSKMPPWSFFISYLRVSGMNKLAKWEYLLLENIPQLNYSVGIPVLGHRFPNRKV